MGYILVAIFAIGLSMSAMGLMVCLNDHDIYAPHVAMLSGMVMAVVSVYSLMTYF